jgi:hypothetical protein
LIVYTINVSILEEHSQHAGYKGLKLSSISSTVCSISIFT